MQEIKNWIVKRSGATMTLNGMDAKTGDPVRMTNVEVVVGIKLGPTTDIYARDGSGDTLAKLV